MTSRKAGAAFTIPIEPVSARTPRPGGKAAPAPARKGPFKFLRKDEGVRADAVNVGEPLTPRTRAARDAGGASAALREAIALDRMRHHHDPLADVVVAVPKRPPPARRSVDDDPMPRAVDTSAMDDAPETDEEDIIQEPPRRSAGDTRAPQRATPTSSGPSHVASHASHVSSPRDAPGPATAGYADSERAEVDDLGEYGRPRPKQTPHAGPDDNRRPAPRERRGPAMRDYEDRDAYEGRDYDDERYDDYEGYEGYGRLPPRRVPARDERAFQRPASRPAMARATTPRERPMGGGHGYPRDTPPRRHAQYDQDARLVEELEQELEAARAERLALRRQQADLARERQRAQDEQEAAAQELQLERDAFEREVQEERKRLRAERRQQEDASRQAQKTATQERQDVKRLQADLDAAHEAAARGTQEARDRERKMRGEMERLRRDLEDVTARNAELTDMVRDLQAAAAQQRAAAARNRQTTATSPITSIGANGGATDPVKKAAPLLDKAPPRASHSLIEGDSAHLVDSRAVNASTVPAAELTSATLNAAPSDLPTRVPTLAEFLADSEPVPSEDLPGDSVTARNMAADGKTEKLFRSGKREVLYPNGTRKVVLPTGHTLLYFSNSDVKRTFPSGKTTYWYAVAQTTHTHLPNGVQLFEFHSSQQCEKHHPDGTKEVLYPDGIYKVLRPDGYDATIFPDGTVRVSQAPS